MRTLEDKRPKKSTEKNQKDKQKSVQKQNIRKTVKTSFKEQYRYDIEVLPHEDSLTVTTFIDQYIQLMSQQNIPQKQLFRRYIVTGINAVMRAIKKCETKYIVFIFFDPKFYDLYEELFINILFNKSSYVIMKPDQNEAKIKQKLKVKKLTCLFFRLYDAMPNHLDQFFKYTMKCRISIPTLYDPTLPPTMMQQVTVTKLL